MVLGVVSAEVKRLRDNRALEPVVPDKRKGRPRPAHAQLLVPQRFADFPAGAGGGNGSDRYSMSPTKAPPEEEGAHVPFNNEVAVPQGHDAVAGDPDTERVGKMVVGIMRTQVSGWSPLSAAATGTATEADQANVVVEACESDERRAQRKASLNRAEAEAAKRAIEREAKVREVLAARGVLHSASADRHHETDDAAAPAPIPGSVVVASLVSAPPRSSSPPASSLYAAGHFYEYRKPLVLVPAAPCAPLPRPPTTHQHSHPRPEERGESTQSPRLNAGGRGRAHPSVSELLQGLKPAVTHTVLPRDAVLQPSLNQDCAEGPAAEGIEWQASVPNMVAGADQHEGGDSTTGASSPLPASSRGDGSGRGSLRRLGTFSAEELAERHARRRLREDRAALLRATHQAAKSSAHIRGRIQHNAPPKSQLAATTASPTQQGGGELGDTGRQVVMNALDHVEELLRQSRALRDNMQQLAAAPQTARAAVGRSPPRESSPLFSVMHDRASPLRSRVTDDPSPSRIRSEIQQKHRRHEFAIAMVRRAASHSITAPPGTAGVSTMAGTCRPSYSGRHFISCSSNALGRTPESTWHDIFVPNLEYVHPPRTPAYGSQRVSGAARRAAEVAELSQPGAQMLLAESPTKLHSATSSIEAIQHICLEAQSRRAQRAREQAEAEAAQLAAEEAKQHEARIARRKTRNGSSSVNTGLGSAAQPSSFYDSPETASPRSAVDDGSFGEKETIG